MNAENKHVDTVVKELGSDIYKGLTQAEASKNLKSYGYNKLDEGKKTNIIIKFFMQFNDFMIMILLMAAGVSLVISYLEGHIDYVDPAIILSIVVINAILGLVQENKAEKALAALKKMSAPRVKVLRQGKYETIDTEYLVPGDIISLETGDFVPADARLIECYNLKVEESALTGESIPIEKDADLVFDKAVPIGDRRNMVFASSSIATGRGIAIVCHTGMNTEVGHIANMILSDDAPLTPLQKRLEHTGKILGIGALIICAVIFILGIVRQMDPFFMFMTSVSLAVAAIPEGLPAIVTIMLAIGVQRMAKQNAIIRKLPAVETLGSASVICSDKTGTLTQNKMKVVLVADYKGDKASSKEKEHILRLSTLCNNSVISNTGEIMGDPTETAIVSAALSMGTNKERLLKDYARVSEIPFDSKRKLMTTIHKNNGYLVITKGAPDVLIDRCNYYFDGTKNVLLTKEMSKKLKEINDSMAKKAFRVLAVSFKKFNALPSEFGAGSIESDLVFAGFIGMIDPPREEVIDAVKICKRAGIKPVMVTGDHVITATAIGEKIGIFTKGDKAMTGAELSAMSQIELNKVINDYSVFARLSPEHKVRIVKAFQSTGAVVAMTGDGVNDAPALKFADIGCAMGIGGTDVAKGASDMILADDNFATIVEAVKEGRGIYENIKKAVHFLLSSNIGEIITILSAILLGFETPLLAIHLLWVNLVTDSLPAIALGLDTNSDDIMERMPYSSRKSLFADGLWFRILIEGCMIGLLALVAFAIGIVFFDEGGIIVGRTMAFTTLSITQLVHTFNMRSDKSIFKTNIFENIYLVGAVIICAIMQVSVILLEPLRNIFKVAYLSKECWLIVICLCFVPILIVELEKFLLTREKYVPAYR